jgi:hypothetical protein
MLRARFLSKFISSAYADTTDCEQFKPDLKDSIASSSFDFIVLGLIDFVCYSTPPLPGELSSTYPIPRTPYHFII